MCFILITMNMCSYISRYMNTKFIQLLPMCCFSSLAIWFSLQSQFFLMNRNGFKFVNYD